MLKIDKEILGYNFDHPPMVKMQVDGKEIPSSILENIKAELRPYQETALKRYLMLHETPSHFTEEQTNHILFNMATGSGKTLIMASLMLYLYEKGYRNFIFFCKQ